MTVQQHWVGTWAAAPQLTEPSNLPPVSLSNKTLRQVVYSSIAGTRVRVWFSNEYGEGPLRLRAVHLALSTGGATTDASSARPLAFSGRPWVDVPPGASVVSDPLEFRLPELTRIAVTMAFADAPSEVTGHPGSRATSYIVDGDATAAATLSAPVTTEHWYYLSGIDVEAERSARAVVVLGDSLTDGRGSTTDGDDRWPDQLSRRLRANAATSRIAVLNLGLGGNAVLSGGLGPTAESRFERDVLEQSGAGFVIVLHGVNDIGTSASSSTPENLIGAYRRFVALARANDLRIYGVPLLPFGGSQYDNPRNEDARQTVNAWIRTVANFDAVIDLDRAVRDPAEPARLLPAYDCGDHLHLNAAGYGAMAAAIDLSLFA